MQTITKTKPRPKVAHTYGAKDITRWKFEEHNLPEPWASHLGILPKRFTMYVDGDPGNGKTEYQIQAAKFLAAHFGKVRVNNVEQGIMNGNRLGGTTSLVIWDRPKKSNGQGTLGL